MSTSINRNPTSRKDRLNDRKVLTNKGIHFWTLLEGEQGELERITKHACDDVKGIRLYIFNDKIVGFHFLLQHGKNRRVSEWVIA